MLLKLRNRRLINLGTPKTRISTHTDSGSTSVSVVSDEGFSGSDKYVLLGEFGDENSEIKSFTSATGDVLTIPATSKDHPAGTPVYLLNANQVQFMRATTASGSYTELTVVTVNPENEYTAYEDTTNSTGFGKARFYNEDADAAYGSYYEIIRYDQDDKKTRGFVKQTALDRCNAYVDGSVISEEMLNNEVSLCDSRIRRERIRWTQESNRIAVETEVGISEYDLSSYLKDSDTIESVVNIWLGGKEVTMVKRDVFFRYLNGVQHTYLAEAITSTSQTEIVVSDSSVLADSGSIWIEGDEITYTSKDDDTDTLSGVDDIGSTHAITSDGGATMEVWQRPDTGKPNVATVIAGKLYTYPVIDDSDDAKVFEIDVINKYDQITLDSDTLEFPEDLYVTWLEVFIKKRRGDKDLQYDKNSFLTELFRYKAQNGSVIERRIRPRVSLYNTDRRHYLSK